MMNIGIDKIGFATANYVLKLENLAEARNIDPEKLSKGLLLKEISVAPVTEDIVTMGASAAASILTEEDKQAIDMVIVASESGIDQSKASAVFVHGLLGIQPFARSFEMKEACYSATAALDYAKLHVEKHPLQAILPNTGLRHQGSQHKELEQWLCSSQVIHGFSVLMKTMLLKHEILWTFGGQIIRQRRLSMACILRNSI